MSRSEGTTMRGVMLVVAVAFAGCGGKGGSPAASSGPLEITVSKARFGPLKEGGSVRPVTVVLLIKNTGSEPVTIKGFAIGGLSEAKLTNASGKVTTAISRVANVEGGTKPEKEVTVSKGQAAKFGYSFNSEDKEASDLILTFPGSEVGQTGTIEVRIPKSEIIVE